MAYGYRCTEVPVPRGQRKQGVKVKLHESPKAPDYRPAVAVSLGPHVEGALMPHADPSHLPTTIAGIDKRFAVDVPRPEKGMLPRLRKFVEKFVSDNFVPLPADSDVSLEKWLASTSYPEWRKEELRKVHAATAGVFEHKHATVKTFEKDEHYVEFKAPRMINHRSDEFKTLVGPIFKLIEAEVFKLPCFIKKVPIQDRPAYIKNLLVRVERLYAATDHSFYEAHFTREVMEAIEWPLYEYMVKNLNGGGEFMRLIRTVVGGTNVCVNKDFTVRIKATRMSGEMNTSLGNGFANLMLMLFMCSELGITEVDGVVEGDDGLFSAKVPKGKRMPNVEDFRRMGFDLKLEIHESINTASFCGLVFDPEDLNNVGDIFRHMTSFGWTTSKYRRCSQKKLEQMLRCKAFSMAYQFAGCPVLRNLAWYGLRVTKKHGAIKSLQLEKLLLKNASSDWERQRVLQCLESDIPRVEIGMNTRLLVEKLYGISVDRQFEIEQMLDSKHDFEPICLDVCHLVPPSWVLYYHSYVTGVADLTKIDNPPLFSMEVKYADFGP